MNIPTVYGEVELIIPAGTQPNQILKLKGQGVKDTRTGRSGDQYVHIKVVIPTSLSKEQKKALEDYRSLTPKSESQTFLDKIKNLFKKN